MTVPPTWRPPRPARPTAPAGSDGPTARADVVEEPGPRPPRRVGHVVLGTPRVAEACAFYVDGLGFRVSDKILDGVLTFTRVEADHHNLLIQPAPVSYLNHYALEMDDLDAIGAAGTRGGGRATRRRRGRGRAPPAGLEPLLVPARPGRDDVRALRRHGPDRRRRGVGSRPPPRRLDPRRGRPVGVGSRPRRPRRSSSRPTWPPSAPPAKRPGGPEPWTSGSAAGRPSSWRRAAGLGRACAESLAREGVTSPSTDATLDVLDAAVDDLRGHGVEVRAVAGDVREDATPRRAARRLPRPRTSSSPTTPARRRPAYRDWDREPGWTALDANLLAPVADGRDVLDGMVERRFGRIVNITSAMVKAPDRSDGPLARGPEPG